VSALPGGVDPPLFRRLLGSFATGVTVLTTRTAGGHPIGMTASSVASVSLDPPLLLVSVERRHDMHAALLAAPDAAFVVNVLAEDQEALSRRFAADDQADRFDGVRSRLDARGIPVLEDVVAHVECVRYAAVPGGDHTVFIGLVTGGDTSERAPLLYYRGRYTHTEAPGD
jgi:flavin reductase (DIM6/NTAB) family NADH-FMN oxidoreductase RutF